MQGQPARTDAENRRLLEQVVPTFERLKTERIRSESDVERCEQALAEARAAAVEELGTSDEAEIEKMIAEAREQNTSAVEQFSEAVRAVDAGLRQLGGN